MNRNHDLKKLFRYGQIYQLTDGETIMVDQIFDDQLSVISQSRGLSGRFLLNMPEIRKLLQSLEF